MVFAAARASRRASPAPCGAGAHCRGLESGAGTEPMRQRVILRSRFAADKGSAAREAAFRIELRASASPAQRRAGVRSERAVGAKRGRPGGHAEPTRFPCTCMRDSPALLVAFGAARPRVSSARRKCGAGARRRGFESGAATEPARYVTGRRPCQQRQRRP